MLMECGAANLSGGMQHVVCQSAEVLDGCCHPKSLAAVAAHLTRCNRRVDMLQDITQRSTQACGYLIFRGNKLSSES